MHKPQCINHDSWTGFKVRLLGIRYTTTGHDDVHPGRTSHNYQPILGHHKGLSPLNERSLLVTATKGFPSNGSLGSPPETNGHQAVTQLVPRSSITQEDHNLLQRLATKRPKGFPSNGSLGSPPKTGSHQHVQWTSTYPSQPDDRRSLEENRCSYLRGSPWVAVTRRDLSLRGESPSAKRGYLGTLPATGVWTHVDGAEGDPLWIPRFSW
eukprot:Gb_27922 [translate_table: standard]